MRKLKSFFSWDALLGSAFLYLLLFTVPLLFIADVFKPFTMAVSDFQISDIYYSSILPELDVTEETEVVLINSVTFSPFGQKNISTSNLARFILIAQDEGAIAIGINAKIDLDSSSENFDTLIEIFAQENVILSSEKIYLDGELVTDSLLKSNTIYSDYLSQLTTRSSSFVNSDEKKHLSIRSFIPMRITDQGDRNLHFALRLASYYNPTAVEAILEDNEEETFINYRGGLDKFSLIEATEFIAGEYGEGALQNKIVLIGDFDRTGVSDEFEKTYYTPLNENTAGRTFPDMYETAILANIISMAISDGYLETVENWKNYILGFVLAYMNMLIYLFIARRNRKWLEFVALIIFVIESILVAFLTIQLISEWGKHDDLTSLVFVAALSPIVFQLYMDTVKPVFKRLLNLFS